MLLLKILIIINIFVFVFSLCIYIVSNIKFIKLKMKEDITKSKMANIIDIKLKYLETYISSSKAKKYLNSIIVLVVSLLLSIITYFFSIIFIKIFSTSLILSLISFSLPYLIITILVNSNTHKIKTILPSYIVNLKNNVEISNNIINAINITKVEEPLKYSIDRFNLKVSRGINVHQCFDELKKRINIETFSNLIDAFKVCYETGGDYINVLNKYIDIISKENLEKAKLKENSSTTIITLVLMILINIFLLFSVVLGNETYSQTILETTAGHFILNFEIISYLVVLYFVYKVYKMEG